MKTKLKSTIEVVRYNPEWPKMFEFEASRIKEALGDNCIVIHHIGSTAVPLLLGRSELDIVVVVKDPVLALAHLEAIGLEYKRECDVPLRYCFSKRGARDVNLHVYEEGHPEIESALVFRDYLKKFGAIRDDYSRLKKQLVREDQPLDEVHCLSDHYDLKKSEFIKEVLKDAGFDRIRIAKCSDVAEWEAAQQFRKAHFDALKLTDPCAQLQAHADHVHLILYRGMEAMGYAHIQFMPDAKAVLQVFTVTDIKKNQSFAGQFLFQIEKWLKTQNCAIITLETSLQASPFYKKNGYLGVPVEIIEGKEVDFKVVPLEKVL